MSAYLELQRDGRLGPAGADLLYRATATAVRRGRFRPQEGQHWDAGAVHTAAADTLVAGGSRLLTSLLIRATDDDSLGRLMVAAATNHLRDRDRREHRGPLIRALSNAVADDANDLRAIETPAGRCWTLPTVSQDMWAGDRTELVAAAFSVVDISLLRWRSDRRRSPIAERASLVAVMTRVIEAAGGPVPYTTMAEVIEHRFSLASPPLLIDLDDEPGPVEPETTPEEQASAALDAEVIFEQLTDRERWVLHLYEEGETTVRELANQIGVSKSTAANTVNRLKQLLAGSLDESTDGLATLQALGDLIDDWTRRQGPTSETGVGS